MAKVRNENQRILLSEQAFVKKYHGKKQTADFEIKSVWKM
jgi:hypothetical protein